MPFITVPVVAVAYVATHPWSLVVDYDFFVGDAVFGGTIGELLYFMAPFDPVGAVVLGASALTMAGLILARPPR